MRQGTSTKGSTCAFAELMLIRSWPPPFRALRDALLRCSGDSGEWGAYPRGWDTRWAGEGGGGGGYSLVQCGAWALWSKNPPQAVLRGGRAPYPYAMTKPNQTDTPPPRGGSLALLLAGEQCTRPRQSAADALHTEMFLVPSGLCSWARGWTLRRSFRLRRVSSGPAVSFGVG